MTRRLHPSVVRPEPAAEAAAPAAAPARRRGSTPARPPLAPRRRRGSRTAGQRRWLLVFLAPYLIGLAVFVAYPVGYSLFGSLTDWPIFGGQSWAGLANYRKLLSDPQFHQALVNTLYYVALLVPCEIAAGLGLALLINGRLRGRTLFRAVYFAPFVFSLASIGLIWTWLFSPDFGLVDAALGALHLPQPDWLNDSHWSMPALVIASIWRNAGYYMVIYLAGLQAVPKEHYEAASVDGAGAWAKFRYVTWPALTPTTFFVGILAIILGFQVFDLSFIMTQGGPDRSTTTLVFMAYTSAFQDGQLGYASAISFALLVLMLILTFFYFAFERRWVHYGR
jgi:ABC-type sugar transport system permease subunit